MAKKSVALATRTAVKELVQTAKVAKAKKEALMFLVEAAKKYQKVREMEEKLTKFVKDNKLGKELLAEAKAMTEEDIEAIEELIEEKSSDVQRWTTSNDGIIAGSQICYTTIA